MSAQQHGAIFRPDPFGLKRVLLLYRQRRRGRLALAGRLGRRLHLDTYGFTPRSPWTSEATD